VHCERRRELRLYEITSEFLVPWISELRERLRRQRERRQEQRRTAVLWRDGSRGWATYQRSSPCSRVGATRSAAPRSKRQRVSHREASIGDFARPTLGSPGTARTPPDVSLLLALDAYQISPREEARNLLVTALQTLTVH